MITLLGQHSGWELLPGHALAVLQDFYDSALQHYRPCPLDVLTEAKLAARHP